MYKHNKVNIERGDSVLLPFLVQLLERHLSINHPERIDDPDVLAEYLSWFHI